MVMVFNIEHVPRPTCQLILPLAEGALHPPQRELRRQIIGEETVGALALELDHHVDLSVLFIDVLQRPTGPHQRRLGEGKAIIVIEYIPFELRQIFVDMGAVVIVGHTLVDGEEMVVGQPLFFGDIGDDILTEAIHAHVQPETQDLLDLLADKRVIHVQIGLLDGEEVEIILPAHLVIGPRLALKVGVPVVGQLAVGTGRPPDVIVGVGFDAPAALLKPLVLITGVVHHQVHQELHAPGMDAVQDLTECLHAAELGGDIHIVGNIVSAVGTGGGIDRGEPDAVTAQGLDVIQFFQHAPEVAHTVAVAVFEATGPDLIKHHILIPTIPLHCRTAFHFISLHYTTLSLERHPQFH